MISASNFLFFSFLFLQYTSTTGPATVTSTSISTSTSGSFLRGQNEENEVVTMTGKATDFDGSVNVAKEVKAKVEDSDKISSPSTSKKEKQETEKKKDEEKEGKKLNGPGYSYFASYQENARPYPYVPNVNFYSILEKTWDGLYYRNVEAYDVKLLHRPRAEVPDDAVSEGIGYGMILALWTNNQKQFNVLIDNAEIYMWNGRYHDWRIGEYGNLLASGAATDAEEDIAATLIFAAHLEKKGIWEKHQLPSGATYASRAQEILDAMWYTGQIADGKYVAPGAGWGGRDFVNPGYFAPAWYKVFARFDTNPSHNWNNVVDQSYDTIDAAIGSNLGMVPDWMTPWGTFYNGGLGYNAYGNGRYFFKDAIRILWRLSTDAIWFQDERAISFLQRSKEFIESEGGAGACNFYDMYGNVVPQEDTWTFDGGRRSRHRYEHSHLTIGQWACAIMGAHMEIVIEENESSASLKVNDAVPYANELLSFYEGGDYWGKSVDLSGQEEDLDHNENYFDQFLAWFGACTMQGCMVDLVAEIP